MKQFIPLVVDGTAVAFYFLDDSDYFQIKQQFIRRSKILTTQLYLGRL